LQFHRDFDVDIEGEILEIFDRVENSNNYQGTLIDYPSELKYDLLLLFAKWCSIAQWRCWDARLFLYVEPYLRDKVHSTEDFLKPPIWIQFQDTISKLDQVSFTESVVLDWMNRRQKLGETMEPSEDPKILPTMGSHSDLSGSLFNFITHSSQQDIELLIGREYLDSECWYLGNDNLGKYGGGI